MLIRRLRRLLVPPKPVPRVAPRFALPAGVRIYAVGDIHGRRRLLAEMLEAIAADARQHPTTHIIEVFLGDYIDRGMYSREVIDMLIARPPSGHQRICLRGNHEETLLRFLDDPNVLRDWANFGGYATLTAYGVAMPTSMSAEQRIALRNQFQQNLLPSHEEFLRGLPLIYQSGDYAFVHAGVLPSAPLSQQKSEHLLWIREAFLNHSGFFEKYIVHGHSPVVAPEIYDHRANLDVSDASISSLCCLVLDRAQRRIMLVTDQND
jgi:serine/threonine protein phosphatase 1